MRSAARKIRSAPKSLKATAALAAIVVFGAAMIRLPVQNTEHLQRIELGEQTVYFEPALTATEHQQGLSGRQQLARNRGMLFDFGTEGQQCMWMKDMNFSLDMIWVNEQKQVVDIQRDVSPASFPENYCNETPARYVLEVRSGAARNVTPGQHLDW